MAISSSLDTIIENEEIVVFGPPASIDIALDIGPQGDRGSRTFTGSVDPNTYTTSQFETVFGYAPIYGDMFVRTSTGENYGKFYIYIPAPAGNQWQELISIYSIVYDFIQNGDYVVPGAKGGTGVANTGKTLTLGGNIVFSGSSSAVFTISGDTNITFPTTGTLATTSNLSQFASTTSSQLAGIISDETGTGSLVFSNSPTLVSPILGSATATSISITGNTVTLNSSESGSPSSDGLFKIERGTSLDVYIKWNEVNDTWQLTNNGSSYENISTEETNIAISFLMIGA